MSHVFLLFNNIFGFETKSLKLLYYIIFFVESERTDSSSGNCAQYVRKGCTAIKTKLPIGNRDTRKELILFHPADHRML
jgi:hypothetical protein